MKKEGKGEITRKEKKMGHQRCEKGIRMPIPTTGKEKKRSVEGSCSEGGLNKQAKEERGRSSVKGKREKKEHERKYSILPRKKKM